MKFILIALFYLINLLAFSQGFSTRYDINNLGQVESRNIIYDEHGISVISQIESGPTDSLYFTRLNELGEIDFIKIHGLSDRDQLAGWHNSFITVEDGYILAGGSKLNDGSNEIEPEVSKFTFDGELVWRYQYPTSGKRELLYAIEYDQGGQLYAVGYSQNSTGDISWDILLLKIDLSGNLAWKHTFDSGYSPEIAGAIQITSNNKLVVGGATFAPPNLTPIGLIHEFDTSGTHLNTDGVYLDGILSRDSGILLFDGEFMHTFHSMLDEQFPELRISHYVRTNSNFTSQGSADVTTYNATANSVSDAVLTSDGIVFCGSNNDDSPSLSKAFIGKLDYFNNLLWKRSFTLVNYGSNYLFGVDEFEGNIACVGQTLHWTGDEPESEFGEMDLWVIKVDENGCLIPGCSVGVEESEEAMFVQVYPNPASNYLNIQLSESLLVNPSSAILSIYSIQGQLVDQLTLDQLTDGIIYNLGGIKSGMYILELLIDSKQSIQKTFVVEKG